MTNGEKAKRLQRLLGQADFVRVKVRVGKEFMQGHTDVDVAIFPEPGTTFTPDEVTFLANMTHGQATPTGVGARFADIEGLGK